MDLFCLNGNDYAKMIAYGAQMLANDVERINALNVFPVPDGDTGTNMQMTMSGGAKGVSELTYAIGEQAKAVARSMVLSARGNSGVILSQFFKGISMALENMTTIDVKEFAQALIKGTKRSYSVVSRPTEGTILTVMREAGEAAFNALTNDMDVVSYLKIYLKEAKKALDKTPELLPVLKKAGVIDSGGAGFILVIEGMLKAALGEEISSLQHNDVKLIDTVSFNANSELTYGYCTEFILQLQNSKVDPKTFDLNIILTFLEAIGNSIVAFKDDDIIKVHVHTFDPGIVLTECRKYGEFITLKIENMNVSHQESEIIAKEEKNVCVEHKHYATVTVANGAGLVKAFKEMGVDEVVTGGQTMNTSTEDFIKAFKKISADIILVYPNNRNILMAAKMAAENYSDAKVVVIPTKSIAEGYSAISMLDFDLTDLNLLIANQQEVINNVHTLEVTYAVRDANIDGKNIQKGQFLTIYDHEVIAANFNRLDNLKEAFQKITDLDEKQVITILCGQDVRIEETNELSQFISKLNPFLEVYLIQGDQDIYSYIIGIE